MRFILKNMKREQVLAALAYGFFLACTSVTLWGGYVRFLKLSCHNGYKRAPTTI